MSTKLAPCTEAAAFLTTDGGTTSSFCPQTKRLRCGNLSGAREGSCGVPRGIGGLMPAIQVNSLAIEGCARAKSEPRAGCDRLPSFQALTFGPTAANDSFRCF